MKKIFKKVLLCISAALLVFLFACSPKVENTSNQNTANQNSANQDAASAIYQNDKDIKIVFTNDIHCGINDNLGVATSMAYYKNIDEKENYKVLVDCGDFSQGGPEGSMTKGEIMHEFMNKLGYDFIVPGNHEFDYGVEKLLRNSLALTGIMYCCNFIDLKTNETVFDPYKIMTFGDKKLAFIGVCTPCTLKDSSPLLYQDEDGNYIYSFCQENEGEKLFEVVQANIDKAKSEGADKIILVAHMGEIDILYPFSISNVMKHLEGVDAIIDGHTHHIYNETVKDKNNKDILVAQAGTKMQDFGIITIEKNGNVKMDLYDENKDGKLEKDKETQNLIDEMEADLGKIINKVLYKDNKILLTTNDPDTGERAVRKKDTNLANFIADAYKYVGNTEIALVNGGGIRDDIRPGDITYKEILQVHPFSNTLCVVKIKGKDLYDHLEFASQYSPEENGALSHPAGMTYTIDTTKKSNVVIDEEGSFVKVDGEYRVKDVMINGEPLDVNRTYTLCGQNYNLVNLGSGNTMFKNVEVIRDNFMTDVEALEEYLKVVDMEKYKDPRGEGRISIIIE